MSTLFISYSNTDRPAAEEMYKRLTAKGYQSPFLDYHPEAGIPAGADWERELYRHLKLCKALLVLCSENWLGSRWCFAELIYAKAMGKEIFPVRIAPCDLPPTVAERQVIDLHAEGEEGWGRLWRGLEESHLSPQDDFGWNPSRPPYPGFMYFDEDDAGVYFGREREIYEVLGRLNQMRDKGDERLLLIHGPSGSGKSSLLRAGVIPRMKYKSGSPWCVMPVFRWNELQPRGKTWAERLAQDLADAFPAKAVSRPDWKTLRERLTLADDSDRSLRMVVDRFLDDTKDMLRVRDAREVTPVLVVDQLEELLVPLALGSEGESSAAFLRFLRCVLSSPSCPWICVASVRSEFLELFEKHPDLQSLAWQSMPLGLMPKDRFFDVIRRPAERVGITFETDALVSRMVEDTGTNDALPLLAFTLWELYDRRECKDVFTEAEYYQELGGLRGCLKSVADGLVSPKAETELAIRQCFVQYLVQLGDRDEFIRRPAKWNDLPDAARPLLEEFVAKRLLRSDCEGSKRIIEVTHEALFRVWTKLEDWLNESRDDHRVLRNLRQLVKHWLDRGRRSKELCPLGQLEDAERVLQSKRLHLDDEQVTYLRESRNYHNARRRRLLALAIVGVVLAVVAITFAWRAEVQKGIAEGQSALAKANAERAEANARETQKQTSIAEANAERAEANARDAQKQTSIAEANARETQKQTSIAEANAERAEANARDAQKQTSIAEANARDAQKQTSIAEANAKEAQHQRSIAEAKTKEAVAGRYQIALARVNDLRQDDPALAMQLLLSNENCPDNLRDFTWSYLFALALESPRRKSGSLRPSPYRELVSTWALTSPALALAFSPESNLLACGLADGSIVLRNRTTGKDDGTLRGHEGAVRTLRFAPQGTTLVSGGDDATVRVWDVRQRELRATVRGHTAAVVSVDVTQDGAWILSGAGHDDRSSEQDAGGASAASPSTVDLKLWDLGTGKELTDVVLPPGPVRAAAFCPGTRSVVLVQRDGHIFCYQPSTKPFAALLLQDVGRKRAVLDYILSPEDDDPFVPEPLADRPSSDPSGVLSDTAQALAFAADGTALAILAQSGKDAPASYLAVRHFGKAGQQDDEEPVSPMEAPEAAPRDLLLPPILTPPPDPPLPPLPPEPDSPPLPPPELDSPLPSPPPEPVATTPPVLEPPPPAADQDGGPRQSERAREEGDVMDLFEQARSSEQLLADTLPPTVRSKLFHHRGQVTAIAFSPNGRTLAMGHSDGGIQLCDGDTGVVRLTLRGHRGPVRSLAFAPDGTALASSSTDADGAVMIHNGLDGSARIMANKPDYWRQAYTTIRIQMKYGMRTGDELHSAAAFLAAAEAELAWEAGNSESAMRRMADAMEHAESWCRALTESWQQGFGWSLDGLAWAIEMRDRMQLASFRVNQPAQQVVAGFVGVESSRLPVLRDVTGGLPLGKTPAREMKVLQEKVRDLELLFRMMLVRHEARVGSRHDSLLAGYHLEVARAGVAWSQGNLEATIDHICFAIRCCESLAEFRKSMARGGLSTYSSVSHAQSLLVNTELTLARLREHQQGIPFAPSLVDVIERTSLEATGKVGADEIAILRRMITELDNLTHLAAERYKSGMIGSGEYDSLARRLERTKADLAWTQGDPAGVRSHLEKALGHAQQAASVARAKLESGRIESEQGIQESALNYFAAKLDLVRLERTSDSDKN